MGQHPNLVTDRQKKSIIAAFFDSGMPMAHIHASRRFPGVALVTIQAIVREEKVKREAEAR